MKLTPIPADFYIAAKNWPHEGWLVMEGFCDNPVDALDDALGALKPDQDYRILCINLADGTSRDVTEDAMRACDWTEPPLPDHAERREAEIAADHERDLRDSHVRVESAVYQRSVL